MSMESLARLEARLRTAEADLAASKFGEREWHDKALEQTTELDALRSSIQDLLEKWWAEAARAVPLATNAATESIRQAALRCAAELEALLAGNARLREALADCLRHLDFEAGDDDQYATGARNKARAALSEPKGES